MPLSETPSAEVLAEYNKAAEEKVRGQIRTHLAAQAVPTLLASVDVNNDELLVKTLNRLVEYVMSGR